MTLMLAHIPILGFVYGFFFVLFLLVKVLLLFPCAIIVMISLHIQAWGSFSRSKHNIPPSLIWGTIITHIRCPPNAPQFYFESSYNEVSQNVWVTLNLTSF
jgi:hypothetical protein